MYHAINHSIYELYVMQSISTVEADSKVILLLVNLYVQLLLDYLQALSECVNKENQCGKKVFTIMLPIACRNALG